MRLILPVVILALLTCPLQAQDLSDLGGFLGGDAGGLLNIAAPRGAAPAGNRGAAPARGTQPAAPSVDRIAGLRDAFSKANLPLNPQQEAALTALMNTEVPAMRRALQERILQLQRERAPAPGTPATPPTPGQRGPATAANLLNPDELLPDLVRLNDQLVSKIASFPALSPEQQALIKKALRDQIRTRGGYDALNLAMEEGGASFTPEQAVQIQAIFNDQNKVRAQMLRDLQGQPADPAKLAQLERDTLLKVLRLLTPAQRTALNAANTKP